MIKRSAFNERVRYLWGAFILVQQAVTALLHGEEDLYECVDCEPLPAMSNSQALNREGHWLWESTVGHGGTSGGFFTGDHVLAVVSASGGGGDRLDVGQCGHSGPLAVRTGFEQSRRWPAPALA